MTFRFVHDGRGAYGWFGYSRTPWCTIMDERYWLRRKYRMACMNGRP